MVCLLAAPSDTKSNVMSGGFRSQLQVSYMFSHTEELWYNETVFLLMTIFMEVEHSGEVIFGCRSHNANLFEQTEHSGIR